MPEYRNHVARDKNMFKTIAVELTSGAHDDLSVTGYSHPCIAFSPHTTLCRRGGKIGELINTQRFAQKYKDA